MLTRPALTSFFLFAVFASLPGCFSPRNTELPQLQTGPPAVENQSYQLHDPFPDRTAGPDTLSRPRGYDRQRTESRQAKENSMPNGVQRGFDPMTPAPGGPPTSWQYPQSVPY